MRALMLDKIPCSKTRQLDFWLIFDQQESLTQSGMYKKLGSHPSHNLLTTIITQGRRDKNSKNTDKMKAKMREDV